MKEPGSSFGKLVLEPGCLEFMKSCSDGPRTGAGAEIPCKQWLPLPLRPLLPQWHLTFLIILFSSWWQKYPFPVCWRCSLPDTVSVDRTSGCTVCRPRGVYTERWARGAHRVRVGKYISHVKRFCLKSLLGASFVSRIATMISETIKTIILGPFASTHQPFIFCAWFPGPFAWLWSF